MPVTRAASYMEGIMGKQVEDNVGKSDILDNTGFRFCLGRGSNDAGLDAWPGSLCNVFYI